MILYCTISYCAAPSTLSDIIILRLRTVPSLYCVWEHGGTAVALLPSQIRNMIVREKVCLCVLFTSALFVFALYFRIHWHSPIVLFHHSIALQNTGQQQQRHHKHKYKRVGQGQDNSLRDLRRWPNVILRSTIDTRCHHYIVSENRVIVLLCLRTWGDSSSVNGYDLPRRITSTIEASPTSRICQHFFTLQHNSEERILWGGAPDSAPAKQQYNFSGKTMPWPWLNADMGPVSITMANKARWVCFVLFLPDNFALLLPLTLTPPTLQILTLAMGALYTLNGIVVVPSTLLSWCYPIAITKKARLVDSGATTLHCCDSILITFCSFISIWHSHLLLWQHQLQGLWAITMQVLWIVTRRRSPTLATAAYINTKGEPWPCMAISILINFIQTHCLLTLPSYSLLNSNTATTV